jgi:hypothetical protein
MSGAQPLAAPQPDHPAMGHARMWQHVGQMDPGDLPAQIAKLDYILPILGSLATNPKVTAKDVIKAAAKEAADGKVPPSEAIKFITQMPADADKLGPWLRTLYSANLSAVVHMKAAVLQQAQGAQQAPQPAMPATPSGPSGPAMPPQGGTPQ